MPVVTFNSHNLPRENGAACYAISVRYPTGVCAVAGYLSKTRRGTWQVDIARHILGRPVSKEAADFRAAKQMARELLA